LRRISTTSQAAHDPAPASSSSVAEKPVGPRVSPGARGALISIVRPMCEPSAVKRPPAASQLMATRR
jgi:hypothetical protein